MREEAKRLMEKRASIERQIEGIVARLEVPGGPGVKGSLIDKEGFPRADINIPQVRADRQRLAALHNDHKDVTNQIEAIILQIHDTSKPRIARPEVTGASSTTPAALPAVPSSRASGTPLASGDMDVNLRQTGERSGNINGSSGSSSVPVGLAPQPPEAQSDITALLPFALIDDVASGSPGEADGLQVGDRLVQFGAVTSAVGADGGEYVSRVARELQQGEGREVEVVVVRKGEVVQLKVTPRQWSGRGLLGCHMRPIV